MEIELPDGTVLDAPDGADVKSVVQGYSRSRLKTKNPSEYDPESQAYQERYGPLSKGRTRQQATRGLGVQTVPEDDTFTEGVGSGMVRADKSLTNFFMKTLNKHPLIKAFGEIPTPSYATDEAINSQDVTDNPLAQTTKGAVGQAVGQTAVSSAITAPIGGAGGVGTGGRVLMRTLTHPATRAGIEGAVGGLAAAAPDQQGAGAAKGAAISALGERGLSVLGRTMGGLVKKSEAAKNLEHVVGQHGEEIFVPISQAGDEDEAFSRLVKLAYAEGLPLVPGVKSQLKRQAGKAEEDIRGIALREGTPDGVRLPADAGANVGQNIGTLKKGFDDAYDQTIKSYVFNVSPTFKDEVIARIKAELPEADATTIEKAADEADKLMQRFSSGRPGIEGGNLLNVKNELGAMVGKVSRPEKGAFEVAQDHVDDIIQQELRQGNSAPNIADLDRFNNLREPYRHFVGLRKAARAARARKGNFTMDQLARNASDPGQLDLANQAGAVTRNPVAGTSFAGRSLVGAGGLLTAAATAGLPTAAGILVGGNLLATKTVQKALLGDTVSQRVITKMVRDNPRSAQEISKFMRMMAAQEAGGSDVGHD